MNNGFGWWNGMKSLSILLCHNFSIHLLLPRPATASAINPETALLYSTLLCSIPFQKQEFIGKFLCFMEKNNKFFHEHKYFLIHNSVVLRTLCWFRAFRKIINIDIKILGSGWKLLNLKRMTGRVNKILPLSILKSKHLTKTLQKIYNKIRQHRFPGVPENTRDK